MNNNYGLVDFLSEKNPKEFTDRIKIGFEKESLRIDNSGISVSPHPKSLGASVSNSYITTDFSESQLELITPPFRGNLDPLLALEDIHHFVMKNINDELLWPLSMPPVIRNDKEIIVASFGSSYEGLFKHIYRLGLTNRYGKRMQTISGFHFNYSLPIEIWPYLQREKSQSLVKVKTDYYFNMLRNIYQFNWLLLYLFGASPVISKDLVNSDKDHFIELDDHNLYLPYATSLRMSEYGYSNSDRKSTYVSINSLEEYVSDLRSATSTHESRYSQFDKVKNGQLNSNILQIEAEYYAVARAKSSAQASRRQSTNLSNGGVDFIEIRSIDLNPFSRVGIQREAVIFLEIFMMYCLFFNSKKIDRDTMKSFQENDEAVAKFGRKPNLKILRNQKSFSMKKWAFEIFEEMLPIAEKMDNGSSIYSNTLSVMKSKFTDPDQLLSSKILKKLNREKISHDQLGISLAESYKNEYIKRKISKNKIWKTLLDERDRSLREQEDLETITRESDKTFNEFKNSYYRS